MSKAEILDEIGRLKEKLFNVKRGLEDKIRNLRSELDSMPRVYVDGDYLRIKFQSNNYQPPRHFRFPVEQVKPFTEWRPVEEKKPMRPKASGNCNHEGETQTVAHIRTCLRCNQEWREEVMEND